MQHTSKLHPELWELNNVWHVASVPGSALIVTVQTQFVKFPELNSGVAQIVNANFMVGSAVPNNQCCWVALVE